MTYGAGESSARAGEIPGVQVLAPAAAGSWGSPAEGETLASRSRCGQELGGAVLVGRPVFWGLAAAGEQGVSHLLSLLREELELAMALAGRPTVKDIDASLVYRP